MKKQTEELLERLADDEWEEHCLCTCVFCESCDGHYSLKELFIGDVLFRFWNKDREHYVESTLNKLVECWAACDLRESLQQIYADAEWEEVEQIIINKARKTKYPRLMVMVEMPKSPAVRELFTLLLELFPKQS